MPLGRSGDHNPLPLPSPAVRTSQPAPRSPAPAQQNYEPSPSPGNLDRIFSRRVPGDHVLGGIGIREVLEDVGLARGHVDHVAGADLDLLLEVIAPGDLEPAG